MAHIQPPDGPFRHLMMDYMDMTQSIRRVRYILVVVCRFRGWIEVLPTPGPNVKSVAKFLCREVLPRFGLPLAWTLESELGSYIQHLNKIHKVIFQEVKGATEDREAERLIWGQSIQPGDWIYIRVSKKSVMK